MEYGYAWLCQILHHVGTVRALWASLLQRRDLRHSSFQMRELSCFKAQLRRHPTAWEIEMWLWEASVRWDLSLPLDALMHQSCWAQIDSVDRSRSWGSETEWLLLTLGYEKWAVRGKQRSENYIHMILHVYHLHELEALLIRYHQKRNLYNHYNIIYIYMYVY